MSCFTSLVDSKFLANARIEILTAKRLLIEDTIMIGGGTRHTFNKARNKQTYYEVGNMLGFFQELYNLELQKDRIYYLQYDKFLMVVSNSKKMVDSAIMASHNVNGDVPVYRGIHTINKMRIHTVLFNTDFTLPPPSVN
jgi:hypothetical protein